MANNHFVTTLYAKVWTYDNKNGGVQTYNDFGLAGIAKSFPSAGVSFRAISPAQVLSVAGGTVNINALVEVAPAGLNQKTEIWAVADTVATLNSAAT
jgi:hypothetical protein